MSDNVNVSTAPRSETRPRFVPKPQFIQQTGYKEHHGEHPDYMFRMNEVGAKALSKLIHECVDDKEDKHAGFLRALGIDIYNYYRDRDEVQKSKNWGRPRNTDSDAESVTPDSESFESGK